MTPALTLVLSLTLLSAWISTPEADSQPSGRRIVIPEAHLRQPSGLTPMRLIFGHPSQTGAQSYLTEIGENGMGPLEELPFSFVDGEFSWDGRFIAFDNCGDRFGKPHGIYVVKLADRSGRKVWPIASKICVGVRWAPDGRRLSFVSSDDRRLRVIDLATEEVSVMPNLGADWHWWSPEGDQIVFERGRGGSRELFITDLEGNERQLTFLKDFNLRETWSPTWSRDGGQIAFVVSGPNKMLSLHTIAPDGTGAMKLETPDTAYSPRWSPDGEWIIYRSQDRLCRIRKDGTGNQVMGELKSYPQNTMGPISIGPTY